MSVALVVRKLYALMMSKWKRAELAQIIGLRIRAMRIAAGFTQEQLSERADISPEYLSRLETARQVPSVHIIIDLARALGTMPSGLLGDPRQDAQAERASRLAAMLGTLTEEDATFLECELSGWMAHLRRR